MVQPRVQQAGVNKAIIYQYFMLNSLPELPAEHGLPHREVCLGVEVEVVALDKVVVLLHAHVQVEVGLVRDGYLQN